jgi:hypothetical protein
MTCNDKDDLLLHKFSYYDLNSFHKKINQQDSPNPKAHLSLFYTNIRSLNKDFDELACLVDILDRKFDIIGLSEIWQPEGRDKKSNKLDGYQEFEYIGSRALGFRIIYQDDITYKVREEFI